MKLMEPIKIRGRRDAMVSCQSAGRPGDERRVATRHKAAFDAVCCKRKLELADLAERRPRAEQVILRANEAWAAGVELESGKQRVSRTEISSFRHPLT
jgi:hypothetical protein